MMGSPEHNARPGYRPDIDGLRAVAVLAVVVYHAFPELLPGGFVGVDVFFVISGFLISSIIFRGLSLGTFSFTEFYAHRVKRIFPALSVVLIAVLVFGYGSLLAEEMDLLGRHVTYSGLFAENFRLYGEAGYFDVAGQRKPLLHLWSLGVEEQFYIVYPLVLYLCWRIGIKLILPVVAIAILSFALNVAWLGTDPSAAFYLPQARFWELMAGGMLAWRISLGNRERHAEGEQDSAGRKKAATAIIGMIVIVVSLLLLDEAAAFPGWWAVLPVAGAALTIAAGPSAWINSQILATRPMVFVGVISYPLYLWHWPLLSFARIITSGTPSYPVRIALVLLAFLLAWLTYRWVERPIRFGRKTWVKTAALCVTLLCIVAFGSYVRLMQGMPERIADKRLDQQLAWPVDKSGIMECLRAHPWAKGGYCQFTYRGQPDVVVIGDSHASHLFLGLDEALKQKGGHALLLGKPGCLPFLDTDSHSSKLALECMRTVNAGLKMAAAEPSVHTVILAGRWPVYFHGVGFGDEGQNQGLHLEAASLPPGTSNAELFERGLQRTLEYLLEHGKKVVFVMSVPELGFDPRGCFDIETPLVTRHANPVPCAVSRSEYDNRVIGYRTAVDAVLARFPAVSVFDPQPQLCDANSCRAMQAGTLLYLDDDHLSVAGSRLLGRSVVEAMRLP